MKKIISFFITFSLLILLLFSFPLDSVAASNYSLLQATAINNSITDSNKTVSTVNYLDYCFQVLDLVNKERAAVGLGPLVMDKDLYNAATVRAEEITRSFSHTRPDGSSCFSASPKMFGENIAYGYSTPESVMDGWMNSQGHKENILRSSFKSIGIACYNYNGRLYWVQCFGTGEINEMPNPNIQEDITNVPIDNSNPSGIVTNPSNPTVSYLTHIQTYGWNQGWINNGLTAGTAGLSKRLEAIQIKLYNTSSYNLGIRYKTHIQSYGWETEWKSNGQSSGTMGQSKRLEAIKIELTGTDSNKFDVYYRVHAQSFGWLGWAKNGENAGGVSYQTHVQTYGWKQGYVSNNMFSGTKGEGKRLEAISIKLTGEVANHYDVYYRVHAQTYGWLGWAKNGEYSGTAGLSKRLEAIQIVLLPKGSAAPSINTISSYITK